MFEANAYDMYDLIGDLCYPAREDGQPASVTW